MRVFSSKVPGRGVGSTAAKEYLGTAGFSLLSLLVLSAALFFSPAASRASHLSQVPENCIDCHSLDTNEGESGTSYISSASRTLPTMKSLNGFVAPDSFGCTYCHSNDLNGMMKGILTHFGFKASKHPVGKIRGGAETQNEYLSAWDTTFLNELDCIDCHDPLLVIDQNPLNLALAAPYANHVTPNTGGRVGNPSMLRASGVMTDLCRGCHGAAPAAWWTGRGKANPPALVDHDEVALAENDTTPLKTSDCADCHDTHYSNNSKLFNDGHEDTAINMGDVSECVTCHYRGDADDNYITHGHGMANATSGTPLNFGCGSCHNVNAQHDGTNPKMLNFLEQGGPSVFGTSLESVCYICHGGYDAHTGGADNVGCLDCHDEHAEGSGPASNLYMIPTNLPNNHATPDAVFFEDNGAVAGNFDYYRGTGDGLCDNQTCHQGLTTGTGFDLWPLSGLMGTSSADTEHSGDYEADNTDCNGCHTHTDTNGSWGAGASCDNCHSYPPNTLAHDKHVNLSGVLCDRCHQNSGFHNETGVADAAQYGSTPIATIRNNVDVVFDTFNPGASYSQAKGARSGSANGTCSTLYCHGDTTAVPDGTDTTPEWNNSATGTCGTCHSSSNPGSNSHGGHLSAGATFGITIGCVDCHTSSAAVSTHVNGEPTFAGAAAAYTGTVDDGNFTVGRGTCSTNACHNDGKDGAPRTAYTWGTAITNCQECHGDSAASHTTEAHDPHLAATHIACTDCHTAATAATHIDQTIDIVGSITYTGDTATTGSTFGSCDTGACHDVGTDIAWNAAATNCDQCHYDTGDNDDFVGDNKTASEVSSTEFGAVGHGTKTVVCLNCHDMAQGHDFTTALSGGNPYRLNAGFTCTDNASNCHDGNPTPTVATVVPHTSGEMVTAGYTPQVGAWGFVPKCTDCHDPHGDGANLSMIQVDLWDKGSSTAGDWGVPTLPVDNTSLVFTDATTGVENTGVSYADGDGPFSSVCQECHETGDADMTAFKDGVSASVAAHPTAGGNPGDCSACHKHDSAFKPSGCSGCHGGTAGTSADGYWPDGVGGNPEDDDGRHTQHITQLASAVYGETIAQLLTDNTAQTPGVASDTKQVEICTYCHDTPGSDGDHSVTMPADVNGFFNIWDKGADAGTYTVAPADTCASVNCHNNKLTVDGTYGWYDAGSGSGVCVMCHADITDTTVGTTGATHDAHTGQSATYGRTIACADCHDGATAWGAPGTDPASNHRDGTFQVSGTVTVTYTGTFPATPGSCGINDCHNDGTGVGAANRAYTWKTAMAGDCASCHLATPATNQHTPHLSGSVGPQAVCGDCHDPETAGTHLNTTVTFSDAQVLAGTAACNTCHGNAAGGTTAKGEWPQATGHWLGTTGGYCEHCHDATPSTVNTASGTGGSPITAPGMMGDGTNYGADVNGHGNVAPPQPCDTCHDATAAHIDGSDGTSMASNRFLGTINGVNVGAAAQVEEICWACHQNAGSGSLVSTHGNTNGVFTATSTHDPNAEAFVYRCDACHEPHGLTLNGRTATSANIYMVKGTVEVKNYSTPGAGSDTTTTIGMIFEATTGANSFDDNDGTPGDNICVACHTDVGRPGSGSALTNAAGDGTHSGLDDYTSTERGNSCVACHGHDYDSDPGGTVDGMMPLQCDGCHAYPPATLAHATHAGSLAGEYGFGCSMCHQNAGNHNELNVTDAADYGSRTTLAISNVVDVVFDSFNPSGTYSQAKGARSGTRNGTCNALYCHGAAFVTAAGGTDTDPEWNNSTTGACGTCHSNTNPGSNSHGVHINASGTFGVTIACGDCHTAATVIATHVTDGAPTFTGEATGYAGNVSDDDNSALLGGCGTNNCHNDGKDGTPRTSGYTWGTGITNCVECHGDTGATHTTESHGQHLTTTTSGGLGCSDCHTAATDGTHINQTINIAGLTYTGDVAIAGTTVGTCGVNACHNNGKNAAARTPGYTWGTAIDAVNSCTECHNATVGTQVTQSHGQHLNASGVFGINTIACGSCHTAATAATHTNGTINLGGFDAAYLVGGDLNVSGTTYGGCGTNSCHNDGKNTAPRDAGYTWGTAITNCAECHGDDLASHTTDAHAPHVPYLSTIGAGLCSGCHDAATVSTHINGTVNVSGGAANYSGTVVVGDVGFGSCTSGACHDVSTDIDWNVAATSCSQCHEDTADINQFVGNNSSASEVNTTEYGAVGHGSKAVVCTDCHDLGQGHDFTATLSGGNPFRLNVGFTCSDTSAGCHPVGTTGPATGKDISTFVTHDDSVMSSTKRTWPGWNPQCVNCHDPHGDGSNISMIQSELYDKASFSIPAGPPPAEPTEQTTLVFTDDSTGADNAGASFADMDSDYSSICQECHEDASMVSFHDGASGTGAGGTAVGANHPSTPVNPGDCTTCHPHDDGFTASGCSGCHGDGGSNNMPDNATDAYPDTENAHAEHVAAIGTGNNSCDTCHPGNPPATHPDGSTAPARLINHDSNDDWVVDADTGNFKNLAGAAETDNDSIYNDTTFTCRNIDCHGEVETPAWTGAAGPDVAGPTWPSGDGLVVTDLVRTGFELAVDWNAADDQTGPVTYELRRSTSTFGGACSGGTQVTTGLGATGYVDTFSTDGTTYFYCVNATDSAGGGGPYTTASTTSASGSASEPAAGGTVTMGNQPGNLDQQTTNDRSYVATYGTADGDGDIDYIWMNLAVGATGTIDVYTGTWDTVGNNWTPKQSVSLTITTATGVHEFYAPGDFTAFPVNTGDAIGQYNNAGASVARTTDGPGELWYTGTGVNGGSGPTSGWTELTVRSMALYATGTSGPPPDTTDPAFGGITNASDQQKGGTVQLTWAATNDTGTGDSNPVVYRVWWNLGASNGDPAQGTHDATTTQAIFTVSGLTDDSNYYFLVRAEDSAGNIDNNTTELQATPTASGGGGPLTCTSCHDTAPTTGAHQKHANNDADYTDCDNCHGDASYSPSGAVGTAYTTAGPGGSVHNNGSPTVYFGAIPDDAVWNGTNCTNVDCHSNTATPNWVGGSGDCAMCHGYPPDGSGGSTGHTLASGNRAGTYTSSDAAFYTAHGVCDTCHGISGDTTPPVVATAQGTPVDNTGGGGDAYVPATHHANGTVEMNGTGIPGDGLSAEYLEGTRNCNKSCHATSELFTAVQANTVNLLRLGGGDCNGCHDGSGAAGTAEWVSDTRTHTFIDTGLTCDECHGSHGGGTVEIPNNTDVGIDYTGNGEAGIALGVAGTAPGATEAEICWNCHDGNGVSEWGAPMTDTNGTKPNYNRGTLSVPDWTSATWTSGGTDVVAAFAYKTAAIESTHAASAAGGAVSGVDPVAAIRCSYCHDVHGTHDGINGDPGGKPYLRGTWMSNPYKEDRAPYLNETLANTSNWGEVPRGSASTTRTGGGYWIDQNSGGYLAAGTWGASLSSGLCALCHGSDVNGTWTSTEIDNIDEYTGTNNWINGGTNNGHSNSVIGGGSTHEQNIYDSRGGGDWVGEDPYSHYAGYPGADDGPADTTNGTGFRSNNGNALQYAPLLAAGDTRPIMWSTDEWAVDEQGGAVTSNYHQFPCSKCHNPHASRLPKLMITNCLDTANNTWDQSTGFNLVSEASNNQNRSVSNWTSAQNCHRYPGVDPCDGRADQASGFGNGWNTITPWGAGKAGGLCP